MTVRTTVTAGKGRVVARGTVMAFDKRSGISIAIASEPRRDPPGSLGQLAGLPTRPTERLKVVFEFSDDPESAASRVDFESTNPREITFSLVNFNDPAGSGTERPIRLGAFEGRSLYVNFRVSAIKGSPKTLYYTFYSVDDIVTAKAQRDALLSKVGQPPPS